MDEVNLEVSAAQKARLEAPEFSHQDLVQMERLNRGLPMAIPPTRLGFSSSDTELPVAPDALLPLLSVLRPPPATSMPEIPIEPRDDMETSMNTGVSSFDAPINFLKNGPEAWIWAEPWGQSEN